MKFSAQEEYGLRCLLDIAQASETESLTIPRIARMEELSEPHVAKLLMILRRAGFIRSTRGHTGGYTLAKRPSDIVLGEVLAVLGGRLYGVGFCDRHSGLAPKCVREGHCMVRSLWVEVQQAVDNVLFRLTLSDILQRKPTAGPVQTPAIRSIPVGTSGRKTPY
jgi:Rrf2 family protein